MKKVAVVGAGLAGLTAAIYLERNGFSVTVFEASDRVGGRVTTDLVDGFRCDRGFQVINPNYSEIKRLNALAGIEFSPISPNIRVDGENVGLSHPINVINNLSNLSTKFLNPFLKGVFLTNPKEINPIIAKEIKKSFIFGRPGVPNLGVAEFSKELANQITKIRLNSTVRSIKGGKVVGNFATQKFDAVIVATSPVTSEKLTGVKSFAKILPSYTWYHAVAGEIANSKYLAIDTKTKLVNSVVISNVSKDYAPAGISLISSTSLVKLTQAEVKKAVGKIWGIPTKDLKLVTKYEIKESLPLRKEASKLDPKVSAGIYIAGDHRDLPSQNGAMRSGRRAALAVIADLNMN
jgi:protoporphyrinogen oxidase